MNQDLLPENEAWDRVVLLVTEYQKHHTMMTLEETLAWIESEMKSMNRRVD